MSSNEPCRAVQPSASDSTGQDPLAEAFKSAVNAFGRPDRMANYLGGLRDSHTTRVHSSVYLPRDSLDRSHPVTPEQSRTAGIPTTNLPSVSNMTDAAHQRLPTLSQVATQGSEPQDHASTVQVPGATVHPTTRQSRIVQPQTSPSAVSDDVGQDHRSKRR
jgi:hypothetical protein